MSAPRISVIIPAKNEAQLLPRCLEALQAQDYPRDAFEVIVVDNASTDGTAEKAAAGGARVVSSPGPTIAAVRNHGVAAATGTILAFTDADCLPNPQWLAQAAVILEREECLTGGECAIDPSDPWISQAWFCLQPKGRERVRCIPTNNLIVPRSVFDKAGGFDESLTTGEDCEFCSRASRFAPIFADEALKVIHLGTPKTLQQFIRRETWHGLGAFGTFRHHWFDKPLLGTLGFGFFTILQIGAVLFGHAKLFALSSLGIIALLSLSVYYRRRHLRDVLHALQLGVLYYCFYFARMVALLKILGSGQAFRHRHS